MNLVTEQEAATKWCPHARYALFTNTVGNRWKQAAPPEEPHALNPIPCRCIGSECMAWRWIGWRAGDTISYDPNGEQPARFFAEANKLELARVGRCGLAGSSL